MSMTSPGLDDWTQRRWYLFVSLKNKLFTRELLRWFVDLCETRACTGAICVVDEPYLFNRRALLGVDDLPHAELTRLSRQSDEIERKAQKAIRAQRSTRVTTMAWQQLSAAIPAWLKAEVQAAFDHRGNFYEQVVRQVILAQGPQHSQQKLERYAGFFLCEIPVLIYAYYAEPGGVVDVYPGETANVLWQIELGALRDELPRTTAFALAGPKLIYVNVAPQDGPVDART
ncbi:MAG: hypothetical protein KKA73_18235 [Chloroflexi bacterium]|nr:hypothetical protein [Chloroflexota bacterium]